MDVAPLRLIELMAALSLATDVGTGQPLEHGMRTALLADRAAESLDLGRSERSAVLYTVLLRFLGCTADASETAVLVGGDEVSFNRVMAPMVMADDRDAAPYLVRHLGEGLPFWRRAGRVASALSDPGGKHRSLSQHCEAGARLAARIGLPDEVTVALAHAYERWDGKGIPDGLAGEAIPRAIAIAVVARDIEVWRALAGMDEAVAMLMRRRGRAYDPSLVDVFVAEGRSWCDEVDGRDCWDAIVDAEGDTPELVGVTSASLACRPACGTGPDR
jgi:hypothetical protein